MSEVHVSVVSSPLPSPPLPTSHDVSLTAEPHDKLHPVTDLGGAKPVHKERERKDVGCSANQDEDL